MQYLKEEVRNRILAAALEEFRVKGYSDASMRRIAKNAGIALGNIYRYFKNKDELFNSIMEPVHSHFRELVLNVLSEKNPDPGNDTIPFGDMMASLMSTFEKYSVEFLIMIDKSAGSKYENVRQEFIGLVDQRLGNEFLPRITKTGTIVRDEFITRVIAASIVEGIIIVLRKYTDPEKIEYLVSRLLILVFDDFARRFK